MFRFAIVGCGRHGERYLRHLRAGDVPGATATALWRRDAGAAADLARRYQVEAAPSLAALLNRKDVDAVVIATPPASHQAEVAAALDAGLPVLVEKPLADTLPAAQRLVQDVRRRTAAPPVMVAQTLRFNQILQQAVAAVPQVGTVHRVRIAQRLEPSDIGWQRERALAGGGSVILTGVHVFDLLRWVMGRTPDAVNCRLRTVEGAPLENVFDACFEFDREQVLAATEVSKFSPTRSGLLEVVGTRGQLWCDYIRGRLERIEGRDHHLLADPGDSPTLPRTLLALARAARGEIACPIPVEDGLETLRMVDACYRSHREGRLIPLGAGASPASLSPS